MKRLNNCLRRIAGKNMTHYITASIGACFVCAGTEALMTGRFTTALILIAGGIGMAAHAVWFLYEILDCFEDEVADE